MKIKEPPVYENMPQWIYVVCKANSYQFSSSVLFCEAGRQQKKRSKKERSDRRRFIFGTVQLSDAIRKWCYIIFSWKHQIKVDVFINPHHMVRPRIYTRFFADRTQNNGANMKLRRCFECWINGVMDWE